MMEQMLINLPKHDEDAPPYASEGVLIVCDGLGSGSQKFEVEGITATNSYFASRETSRIVSKFLEEHKDAIIDSSNDTYFAGKLHEAIIQGLKQYSEKYSISLEKLGLCGSVIRTLPTTLSSIVYGERNGKIECICFWAGDSRCYCIDPKKGLMQLTTDDSIIPQDALESLIEDSPMSNVINISSDFHINCARYVFDKPCILMAASDGMFAYQDSPMHFEYEFLPKNEEFDVYSNVLKETENRHQDDCTLACTFIGIDSLSDYNDIFKNRSEFLSPMIAKIDAERKELDLIRETYRKTKKLPMDSQKNIDAINNAKKNLSERTNLFDSMRKTNWDDYKTYYYPEAVSICSSSNTLKTDNRSDNSVENQSNSTLDSIDLIETVSSDSPPQPLIENEYTGTDNQGEFYDLIHKNSHIIKRIDLELGSDYERIKDLNKIDKYKIKIPFSNEYGFFSSVAIDNSIKIHRGSEYTIFIKPKNKHDEYRKNLIESPQFKSLCESEKLRLPNECKIKGDYILMSYKIKKNSSSIPILFEDIQRLNPRNRVEILLSIAQSLTLLHSKGIVLGSVFPEGFEYFTLNEKAHAEIKNFMYLSENECKVKIDKEHHLCFSYDMNCFGMLICELYLGKRIESTDELNISDLSEKYTNRIDRELYGLTNRILFGDKPDAFTVTEELKRIIHMKDE